MQTLIIKFFKIWHHVRLPLIGILSKARCTILFYVNGVKCESFTSYGMPYIHVSLQAQCIIGKNFKMNNGLLYSDSGVNGKCRIEVRDEAVLTIGNNVGMSDVTITCHEKISIGNNILLGVGSQIRDTDNHSLNSQDRLIGLDWKNKKTSPIIIKDNVFIGAYSFILKGVTIGENSIVGAGSVVTKNIPNNEIWAGNPAKFIRKNNFKTNDFTE
jgi:acetyltransferase-like isoleucine patch superfamily enzyme